MTTARSVEQLRDGTRDAAFVRLPLAEADDLDVIEIGRDPLTVALPATHRLARRRFMTPADLQGQRIVFWPREQGPGFYDWVVTHIYGGTLPDITRVEPDTEQMVRAVARRAGCAVTTRSRASLLSARGVVFKRFAPDVPAAPLGLAWRASDSSPPLRRLVAIARKLSAR